MTAMTARSFRRTATAMVVASSLALAACQTTSTGTRDAGMAATGGQVTQNLTPAEAQLRDEAAKFNETVAGGVVTGLIIGGLLGALAGSASGNNRNSVLTGALIGAAAGGILGGVDGYMTAKAQENANNKVRMLNAMADDVRKDNQTLQRQVDTANQVLADSKAQLEQIKQDVASKKMTVDQANAERVKIEENRALLQTLVNNGNKKLANYRDASKRMKAQGTNTTQMDAQIAQLEAEVAKMEQSVSNLNSALEVTRVG